jgi:hypothetical protein
MSNAHRLAAGLSIAAGLAATLSHETSAKEPPVVDPDIPDRLSVDRRSKFFVHVGPLIGVRVNGEEAYNVVEFCVSEGWIKIGTIVDGKLKREYAGGPIITRDLFDVTVEPYWRAPPSRQVRRQLRRLSR